MMLSVDIIYCRSSIKCMCTQSCLNLVIAELLPGILGAVAAVLLILGGGLYLWKIRRKKMETGKGRFPFSFHAHKPLFLIAFLISFLLQFVPLKCPCRGFSRSGHGLCP